MSGSPGRSLLLLATPLVGVAGARARLDWEAAHITFLRLEAVGFVWLGAVIVSAMLPGRPITTDHSSMVNRE